MQSIIAQGNPIILDIETNTQIYIEYCTVNPQWNDESYIEHTTITNRKEFVPITTHGHAKIKIEINLWKYGSVVAPNKFAVFYGLRNKEVCFSPKSDGVYLKDANNNNAIFYVTNVDLYWKTRPYGLDTVVLELKSKTPIKLA